MQICLFYIARERNDTCNQARKIVRVEASDSKPSLRSIARFKNDSSRFLHTILHNMYFVRSLNRVIYTSTSRIKTIMIFVQDTFIIVIVSNILLSSLPKRKQLDLRFSCSKNLNYNQRLTFDESFLPSL